MKILMYSDSFGGNTTTFINNEIQYLSQKHDLRYLCTKKSDIVIFDYKKVDVIEYKPNRIINKFKWWLWKSDLNLDFFDKKFSDKVTNYVNRQLHKLDFAKCRKQHIIKIKTMIGGKICREE